MDQLVSPGQLWCIPTSIVTSLAFTDLMPKMARGQYGLERFGHHIKLPLPAMYRQPPACLAKNSVRVCGYLLRFRYAHSDTVINKSFFVTNHAIVRFLMKVSCWEGAIRPADATPLLALGPCLQALTNVWFRPRLTH